MTLPWTLSETELYRHFNLCQFTSLNCDFPLANDKKSLSSTLLKTIPNDSFINKIRMVFSNIDIPSDNFQDILKADIIIVPTWDFY